MSGQRRYPAIYAGLAGALGAGIPNTALAAPSARGLESLASGIVLPLFFGTLVGAGVVGIAALVTSREDDDDEFILPRRETQIDYLASRRTSDEAMQASMSIPPVGLHMAISAPAAPAGPAIPVAAPAPAANPRARLASVPMVDAVPAATGHLNALSLHQQASQRMRGVASVLSERISGDPLGEGVMLSRSREAAGAKAASRWEGASAPASQIYAEPAPVRREAPAAQPRRQSIADRIAVIDEFDLLSYPQHEEESADDLWNSALMALDERLIEQPLSFSDAVGDSDTLDEPDGLEVDTDFIPFRPPAGHPEVVDTESYVDYLVRQEFALNAARHAAHLARESQPRFLRLVEGGADSAPQVQPRRLILSPAERKLAYRPRHLKPEFAAQEA